MAKALLTPVPLEHLRDGESTCRRQGRVAFGSQAWEVFADLGEGAHVLIYASHSGEPPRPVVSWEATFVRYIRAEEYAGDERRRYRPPSAEAEDAEGYWAGYYEVTELKQLSGDDAIPVATLRDKRGRPYPKAFIPEGPILVTDP